MAVEIPVPDSSYSEVNISLSGSTYNIIYKLNSRDNRLYFDIYLEDSLIKSGIKVMEDQSLLGRYLLDDFLHGDIFCLSKENTNDDVSLDNIGFNKPYGLFYLTNSELI